MIQLIDQCDNSFKFTGNFMCGGTIINKRYIITAAHCLFDGKTPMKPSIHTFEVMVGEHNQCDGVNEGGKVKREQFKQCKLKCPKFWL